MNGEAVVSIVVDLLGRGRESRCNRKAVVLYPIYIYMFNHIDVHYDKKCKCNLKIKKIQVILVFIEINKQDEIKW